MSHLNFHAKTIIFSVHQNLPVEFWPVRLFDWFSNNVTRQLKKPFLGCFFVRREFDPLKMHFIHLLQVVVVQVTKGVLIPAWTASVLNCVQNETNCPLLAQVTCPVLKDVQGISWNGDEDNGLRRRESERREIKRRKKAGLYLWYSGIVYALLDSLRAIQFRRKYCWGI